MLCSNCYTTVNEEDVVYSCVDKSPMHKDCANICKSCGEYLTDLQFMRNKCKCVTQIKSSLEVVRRSHIDLYKTCPHAFYRECVLKEEQETNKYALHGIILHEIFDKYSLQTQISKENLQWEFAERWEKEKGDIEPGLNEQLYEKGLNAIDGFMAFHDSVDLPFITEENIIFSIDDSLPKVSITMDRVDKDENDDYHMYDYKCGKTFTGKKLEEDLQLPLYCYAMLDKYGKLPKSFTFLFVSEGKERKYELIDERTYRCTVRKKNYDIHIDERIRYTKTLLKDIADEKFGAMSTNFWHCNNFCYYKKVGKCNGGDTLVWGK